MTEEVKVKEKKAKKSAEPKYGRIRDGLSEEQIAARLAELQVEELPPGAVKLAEISTQCKKEGIPVSKLVRATGGDRAIDPPVDPVFQVMYLGRTRYLSGDVLTKGMELLRDPEFLRTRRKRKAKEAGDGESGPVKGAKQPRKVVRPASGS